MKNEVRPMDGVSVLSLLQRFNTAGWIAGKTSGRQKLYVTYPKSFSSETEGKMWKVTPVHLENAVKMKVQKPVCGIK